MLSEGKKIMVDEKLHSIGRPKIVELLGEGMSNISPKTNKKDEEKEMPTS